MSVELLAPAKNKECAFAAIDFGADALYIGANSFGARKKAFNSIQDIKEIVDYAHIFGVKVYVTLNTILTDKELLEAEKLVKELEKIKIDALITQDMGLLKIKTSIPFHASTQCDNRTVEKVKFLEDVGFERVVLARELSLEQIKKIRNSTKVQLEAFIHGALCVSYSGQCYLSYAIGGRSANRGECAQPCRKKYSLVDETGKMIAKDKYLLSLKDFNASDYLKQLADAGVCSFKIEGRLKDVNYVKNVVGFYRKKIDELNLGKTSFGNVEFDFEPDLQKSFNRDFTSYFLEKREKCFSFDSVKSLGEYLGKIEKVGKDFFVISGNSKLNPQDGLCFENDGCLVNKIEGNKIYPNKMPSIKTGTKVFRNFDLEFEKILSNSKTKRKIPVEIEFYENKIEMTDEQGFSVEIDYKNKELAKNTEKAIETIEKQLKKSGETSFSVKKVEIKTSQIPFLPVSELNELRRNLFESLLKKRLENYVLNVSNGFDGVELSEKLDYRANILNKSAKEFYENCGCKVCEMALESGIIPTKKAVMTTKHCLKYAFDMCKSNKKLFLIDEKNKKYELKFNCKNCEMEIIF